MAANRAIADMASGKRLDPIRRAGAGKLGTPSLQELLRLGTRGSRWPHRSADLPTGSDRSRTGSNLEQASLAVHPVFDAFEVGNALHLLR